MILLCLRLVDTRVTEGPRGVIGARLVAEHPQGLYSLGFSACDVHSASGIDTQDSFWGKKIYIYIYNVFEEL